MCRRRLTLLALLLPACAAAGCAALRPPPPTARACAPAPARGVVFVADGAGGFRTTSAALRQAVAEAGAPLHVETVAWSHGAGRVLADQMDFTHARAEGRRLAAEVKARRLMHPGQAVYLVGHSAGCAVVLAAAEEVPPATVEGVVLLAPSVSARYDVRPALRGTRRGIDVFYSERDVAMLGVGAAVVGTADRHWTAAAGRVGFRTEPATREDVALYAKLRQHAWSPEQAWTGHLGGHRGGFRPAYLRAYVLPLFTAGTPPP